MRIVRYRSVLKGAVLALIAVATAAAASDAGPAQRLDALANRFVLEYVAHDPTSTYWSGIATQDHSRFPDRSAKALGDFDNLETKDLAELGAYNVTDLSPASRVTYAVLKEQLRQQAVDYLVSTGRFDPKSPDDLVDRIAAMPGQLTAYDSGGLEIKTLRSEAEKALGAAFDLREFNRVVLECGVVSLTELRFHVMARIRARQARG